MVRAIRSEFIIAKPVEAATSTTNRAITVLRALTPCCFNADSKGKAITTTRTGIRTPRVWVIISETNSARIDNDAIAFGLEFVPENKAHAYNAINSVPITVANGIGFIVPPTRPPWSRYSLKATVDRDSEDRNNRPMRHESGSVSRFANCPYSAKHSSALNSLQLPP